MSLGCCGWPSVISVDPCQAADVLASAAGHNGTLRTPSLLFFCISVIILERVGCLRIKRRASVIERNSVRTSRYIDFESVCLIMSSCMPSLRHLPSPEPEWGPKSKEDHFKSQHEKGSSKCRATKHISRNKRHSRVGSRGRTRGRSRSGSLRASTSGSSRSRTTGGGDLAR